MHISAHLALATPCGHLRGLLTLLGAHFCLFALDLQNVFRKKEYYVMLFFFIAHARGVHYIMTTGMLFNKAFGKIYKLNIILNMG